MELDGGIFHVRFVFLVYLHAKISAACWLISWNIRFLSPAIAARFGPAAHAATFPPCHPQRHFVCSAPIACVTGISRDIVEHIIVFVLWPMLAMAEFHTGLASGPFPAYSFHHSSEHDYSSNYLEALLLPDLDAAARNFPSGENCRGGTKS
jgi:hypothetical protein